MPWPGTPKSQQSPPINPPSTRFPYSLDEKSSMQDVADFARTVVNGLTNHEQAFANLPTQIATQAKTAATQAIQNISSQITTGVTSFNTQTGAVIYFPNLGRVNDQLGNLVYLTQTSDAGQDIILGDSSPVTVTLNTAVTLPWFAFFLNDSSANATFVTDSTASIVGSPTLTPNASSIIFFDGTTFWVSSGGSAGQIVPFGVTFDGGSSSPVAPIMRVIEVPFNCNIQSWTISADSSGSASCDVWFSGGSAPPTAPPVPTSANKISASAPINLTSQQTNAGGSSAISTWTTPLTQWGVLAFNLTSVTSCKWLSIQIQCVKT